MIIVGVGPQIVADYKKFDWNWVYGWQKYMGWGKMKHNTLWVGMKGVFTQAHYDEAHNFFCQVNGRKKFLLFHPSQFPSLYVYPYHHPADRQSQVLFPTSSPLQHLIRNTLGGNRKS